MILAIASDLALRMGMSQVITHPVKWQQSFPLSRAFLPVPSDQPLARKRYFTSKGVQIVLPHQMRGRLRPEEWRPLIASLFASSKIRKKKDFISPLVAALLLLGAGGLILIQLFFSTLIPQSITLVWLIGLVVFGFSVPRVMNRIGRDREDWLKADRMAADVAGKDAFLEVLIKIDSMRMSDVEALKKGKGPWLHHKPNITERVKNLEDFPGEGRAN